MNTDEKIAKCARAAHNTMVTYCRMHGDDTIKEWENAEGWQREATIEMVKSVLSGNYSPAAEHQRWYESKQKKGYIYGAVKNDDKDAGPLTNPNMVPYKDLPIVQRMKDHLLIVVTVGIAAHYELNVEKVPELTFA